MSGQQYTDEQINKIAKDGWNELTPEEWESLAEDFKKANLVRQLLLRFGKKIFHCVIALAINEPFDYSEEIGVDGKG